MNKKNKTNNSKNSNFLFFYCCVQVEKKIRKFVYPDCIILYNYLCRYWLAEISSYLYFHAPFLGAMRDLQSLYLRETSYSIARGNIIVRYISVLDTAPLSGKLANEFNIFFFL